MADYPYGGQPLGGNKTSSQHVVPPRDLPGFPDAVKAKSKTPRPGGGLRMRWKDKNHIYEWDYQHGTVEVYDSRGHHIGEYDPNSGKRLNGPVRGRKVEP